MEPNVTIYGNEAMNVFYYFYSHSFNTPVNYFIVCTGFTEVLPLFSSGRYEF